jgi:hypothetical protein
MTLKHSVCQRLQCREVTEVAAELVGLGKVIVVPGKLTWKPVYVKDLTLKDVHLTCILVEA